MPRLPRHLSASLLCGLIWASSVGAHARELRPSEPLRVTLVSLARQAAPATAATSGTGNKLSVRSAWASDAQARLCALTLDAQGQAVIDQGRFQVRRVRFEKHQATWRVQRVDTTWLAPGASLDAACSRPRDNLRPQDADASGTQLARRAPAGINVAIAELERHPPTAGMPNRPQKAKAELAPHCQGIAATNVANETAAANWLAGQVRPAGRSHLFTVPDRTCPMGKHLVQNDRVRIGPTRQGWTQVRYTHPITKVVTVGWLPSQRVGTAEAQLASAAP